MNVYDKAWERYRLLMEERPELFERSDELSIVTDKEQALKFAHENDRLIGVLYESPYSLLIVDLVEDRNGNRFAYERIAPRNIGGIVSMPKYDGRFVLLKQYRHAPRKWQIGFPRGFGEQDLPAAENLRKELSEELGADVLGSEHLGSVYPDSGISSGKVDFFSCTVTEPKLKKGYEGIRELIFMTEEELRGNIASGDIDDGFTITAYGLYSARNKNR